MSDPSNPTLGNLTTNIFHTVNELAEEIHFFHYLERPRLVHMILRNFSSLALYIRILIDELKTSEK